MIKDRAGDKLKIVHIKEIFSQDLTRLFIKKFDFIILLSHQNIYFFLSNMIYKVNQTNMIGISLIWQEI